MGYLLKMNRKEETPSNGFFGGIKGKGVPQNLYYPFAGVYDILGDEKKEFVRGLSKIFDIDIIEEDEAHIRIVFTEKNYVYHTPEEIQKTYADFVALMNRMEKQISMVPVFHEETFGRCPNNEKSIKTNNWLKMHHMPMRRTVPKKYRRNKILATLPLNVLLIGTSGTGKSRRFVLPNTVGAEQYQMKKAQDEK